MTVLGTRAVRADAPRLVRADVRPYPGGTSLLVAPSGRMFRVPLPPAELAALLDRFDGTRAAAELGAAPGLVDLLVREGCVADGPADPHWARFDRPVPEPARLLLVGDRSLTALGAGFPGAEVVADLPRERTDAVVVALRDRLDPDWLRALDDRLADLGIRWTQLHLDRGRGFLGPHVAPGRTPAYRDVLDRRLAAVDDPDLHQALVTPPTRPYLPPEPELRWLVTMLLIDVERWLAGAPAAADWHELEADPATLTTTRHPVLPVPGGRRAHDPGPAHGDVGVVDARTGIVTLLDQRPPHPAAPQTLVTVLGRVADLGRLGRGLNDRVSTGSTFGDVEGARLAAVGEALERYCGNVIEPTAITEASYAQLHRRGEHAVDPDELVLFSARQHARRGFPFVPLTRDLRVCWVAGRSLTRDVPAWLPASLTYVNWYTGEHGSEPPTNNPFYPGIAAGPTLEQAIASGLQEVVERHATMVWWANRQPLPAVRPSPALAGVWDGTGPDQRAWLIHLDNEFGIPVMAGVVDNAAEGLFTIGFGARPTPEQAALKAWTEALTLQDTSRDLLDPDGDYRGAVRRGEVNGSFMKPWRADRRYLDDYRADFRDAGDLMCQQQVWLDRRARAAVASWLDRPATRQLDTLPRLAGFSLAAYRQPVEAAGYEVFYADLTTPDAAAAGLRVVRVLVPGLVPNFSAAFPFLGRGALAAAAVRLGWRDRPLAEEDLNVFPMPHA